MAKRKDEDLNLTPFIDLFSTLVVFLLLTAVWNQLSSLTTNIENATSSDSPPPPEKQIDLAVTIFQNRLQILDGNVPINIPNLQGETLDTSRLEQELSRLKQKYPEKEDFTLNTANNTSYGNMILVFDTLVGIGFPEVGVNTQ